MAGGRGRERKLNITKNLDCNFIYIKREEIVIVWFTVLRNILIRPLNWCWRNCDMKWRRTSNYIYGFGLYESPEGGKIELAKYTFSKNYYNDTANLIIEALPKAYEARVFIHVDKIQQHPENNVGVHFPNISILSKLDNITTCWNWLWMSMVCRTMLKRRKWL